MALPAIDRPLLLADLRRTKAFLTPEELAHRQPRVASSGLPLLDELLGGGLPEGKTVAVTGRSGAGATGLSLSVLSAFTARGVLAALVDRGDRFDPASAADAGVSLERLLWCRPATAKEAVKAADALLASGAFPVVVLDLRGDEGGEREPPGAAWLRLSRAAEASRAHLLVLGGAAGTGAFAAISISCGRSTARFSGVGPGRTFEGIEVELSLAHNRLGLAPGEARLAFRAPDHFPGAAPGGASGDPSCRGPRGAREGLGDPWAVPPEASAANTSGERLGVQVADTSRKRRVRLQEPSGEPRAAGGRRPVWDEPTAVDEPGRHRAALEGGR